MGLQDLEDIFDINHKFLTINKSTFWIVLRNFSGISLPRNLQNHNKVP